MGRTAPLRRQLGLATLTALVIGEVTGVGIFLTPARMARSLGSPFWLLLVWLAVGLMSVCGALCYGALAARYPETGGGYVYLKELWGRRVAFLYGWKCLFVLDPGLTAALAVGGASYAAQLLTLPPQSQPPLAVGTILAIGAVNAVGVRLGAGLLRWLTAAKLGLLALLIGRGWLAGLGDWSHFNPLVAQRPGSAPLLPALGGAFVAAFFSFGGWWDASKVSGEIRDPDRTIPRALVVGVSLVTLVYILTSAAFFYLVPLELVTTGEAFAAQAGEVLFGPAGARVFAAIVVICVLGSLAGFMMAAPRVYYAMARDGLFLRSVADLHSRFGTPARAIALQTGLAALLAVIGGFDTILAYFIFVTVLFVALTVAGIFRLQAGIRPVGHPVTPLLFLALSALLLFLLALNAPLQALLGTAVVALGWPAYSAVRRQA